MKRGTNTKTAILNAFDESEKQTIAEVCRIAGTTPSTFWFHLYKDAAFRRNVLVKRMDYLAAKLAAEPINRGENV